MTCHRTIVSATGTARDPEAVASRVRLVLPSEHAPVGAHHRGGHVHRGVSASGPTTRAEAVVEVLEAAGRLGHGRETADDVRRELNVVAARPSVAALTSLDPRAAA